MEQTLKTKKPEPVLLSNGSCSLEEMRRRINDENYLNAAIQRLALVMSYELLEFSKEGKYYERQRKRR
jgi:hypothetical protein